jgi:hypothetical protein
MNVTIERRQKCLTDDGKEEGRYDCGIGVIHGGIPHGGACPPAGHVCGGGEYPWPKGGGGVLGLWLGWQVGGGGDQYPVGGSGGQYPAGCGGGGHVKIFPLWESLPTTSQVLDPYENPRRRKFDSCMSKNLNYELKKEENYTYDPSKRGVEGSSGLLGHRPYGERPMDCMNYINHLLSN